MLCAVYTLGTWESCYIKQRSMVAYCLLCSWRGSLHETRMQLSLSDHLCPCVPAQESCIAVVGVDGEFLMGTGNLDEPCCLSCPTLMFHASPQHSSLQTPANHLLRWGETIVCACPSNQTLILSDI